MQMTKIKSMTEQLKENLFYSCEIIMEMFSINMIIDFHLRLRNLFSLLLQRILLEPLEHLVLFFLLHHRSLFVNGIRHIR